MSEEPLIVLNKITRSFSTGVYSGVESHIAALNETSLTISHGEFIAIMGPSGSGKSTLLNIIGLLIPPTSGEYRLEGQVVSGLSDSATSRIRGQSLGIIFQSFNLLAHLSAIENVCVPMQYTHIPRHKMIERARFLLQQVGLGERERAKPTQLSGGQCQRIAIARALANDPPVILADEPTGNLDQATGDEVMAIFKELHARGKTIIMVTHNPDYQRHVQRSLWIHDGKLTEGARNT